MIKGLKRLGILALSAVIAMGAVTAIMPAKEVYADDEYKPLTAGAVVKDWDFHTGLYKGMYGIIVKLDDTYSASLTEEQRNNLIGKQVKGKTVQLGEQGLIIKFTQGYKSYDGKLFDVYMRLTTGPSKTPDTNVKFLDNDNGGGKINEKNGVYYISLSTGVADADGTDFDYEIWLRNNDSTGSEEQKNNATNYDTPATPIDQTEMFIGGNNYMAGKDYEKRPGIYGTYEGTRPWSSDGTLYSNDQEYDGVHHWAYEDYTFEGNGNTYSAWLSDKQAATDNENRFVIGYGYTPEHSIKSGYTNRTRGNSGVAEIILGYRVRKLIFEVYPGDGGYKDSTLKVDTDEYLEGSVVSRKKPEPHYGHYMPDDTFSSPAKLKTGYQFAYWTTKQDVELVNSDGSTIRTIKAGEKITEADMPYVKIVGNEAKPDLVFYAHTVNDPVKLNYYIENEQLNNIFPSHTPGTIGTVSYEETYQRDTENTVNGSYKKEDNVVIKGKDGKDYKLVGWFNEPDFETEYNFGSPLHEDKNIYAKWEVVVDPPKPDPEPKKDDDTNNDNPGSSTPTPSPTPTPIRVDFVSQVGIAPLPQIKNVGEKATDPGAPFDPATLQPGTVINGYRFEGWFLDPAYALPYDFNTVLTKSIILYAKWVRVSPKTGDTTIPPIYYILGTAALAGAGLLIYRRKVKN